MWSSKMAARWRRKDGLLNGNNGDFPTGNSPREMIVSRGDVADMEKCSPTCVDHSILAIFEDSTVAPENKRGVDEENEKLLSALTEMLDSVGDDDDDVTLSPFDTLPESQLLIHPVRRDNPAMEPLVERLRPRPKSLSVTVSVKSDGVDGEELFKRESQGDDKAAENEVEVFTSAALVNLVKLMHPYCLKLHVDEGDTPTKNSRLLSGGEVWRYEKPTEESDEEINVVSDDEAPQGKTEAGEQGLGKGSKGRLLKSALVKRNSPTAPSSKEKKRVSFGSVQVASFDEPPPEAADGKNLSTSETSNGSEALVVPPCSTSDSQTPSSDLNGDRAEAASLKGETKAKALSLQQYRQLRRKRQPPVEKRGDYTTKWPSVSEPPKELPPFPCLEPKNVLRHSPSTSIPDHPCKPASHQTTPTPRPKPSQARPSCQMHRSGLKRPRTESRMSSPASPLLNTTGNINVVRPQRKKSLVRKATLASSDPPNPVLLPLAPSQQPTVPIHSSSEPTVDRHSSLQTTRHLQGNQIESSDSCRESPASSQPKPQVLLLSPDGSAPLQEIKDQTSETSSDVSSTSSALCSSIAQTESAENLQPQKYSPGPTNETKPEPQTPQSPSADRGSHIQGHSSAQLSAQSSCSLAAPMLARESPEVLAGASPHEEPPPIVQRGCEVQTGQSGIEAPDLTSLLEQFEETQAKEENVYETNPGPKHIGADVDQQVTAPVNTENASAKALEPIGTSEDLRNLPGLLISEHEHVPEALSIEITLSTQKDQPARRRNPPSKAIQIIDPRPLPPKKTHPSLVEVPAKCSSAHLQLSVASDHDYCGPADRSLTSATQRSRAKPSSVKDIAGAVGELQVHSCDSGAAAQRKTQTSSGETRCLSAQPKARPEAELCPDKALLMLDCATGDGGADEHQTAPCTLPTPPPSPLSRGREKRRYRRRSPQSDFSCSSTSSSSSSSSSSGSRSPKRQKLRHKRSESSSCSPSSSRSVSRTPPRRNRLPYSRSRCSRSRSRSWSRSRSRSPSPRICRRRWRDVYSSRDPRRLRREQEVRIQKLKAIDERRVVYVGRIRRSMTHSELRERFSQFGEVECVSLHFRDRGDHYAFVTFYNMEDAFAAIDNGGKLRRPDELPFDLCFGGRRQFCNSNYSDLDADRDTDLSPAQSRLEDLDFDSLLKQAQRGLKR